MSTIYTNVPLQAIAILPHPRIRDSHGQKTFSAQSDDKQIWNYDTECPNHHPILSSLTRKWLILTKRKWWAIYTNLAVKAVVRLPHPYSGDNHGQQRLLAHSDDKKTRNCDTECSDHYPTLSSLTPKGLRLSKIKWWMIYTNLLIKGIVRLLHPRSGDSHDQKTFLAPSADKQNRNYDAEFLKHHSPLSTLKGLSRSKMKWWAIYTNLPVNDIVRLLHLSSGFTQGHKMFLSPSADKQTCRYDTQCSNHHPTLSTVEIKGMRP